MNSVNIDPIAALAESSALNKYYHDRNLLLANANVILMREKSALEAERDGLLNTLATMQEEIEALKNGVSS